LNARAIAGVPSTTSRPGWMTRALCAKSFAAAALSFRFSALLHARTT